MHDSIVLIVVAGVGTFLLRFVPMLGARRSRHGSSGRGFLYRFFQAIGPAAISSLLVVSLWPELHEGGGLRGIAAICAIAILAIAKRFLSGLAAPVFVSAVVYGAVRVALGQ